MIMNAFLEMSHDVRERNPIYGLLSARYGFERIQFFLRIEGNRLG